jgi:hypothetical protein
VSDSYGVKDAACPISTKEVGGVGGGEGRRSPGGAAWRAEGWLTLAALAEGAPPARLPAAPRAARGARWGVRPQQGAPGGEGVGERGRASGAAGQLWAQAGRADPRWISASWTSSGELCAVQNAAVRPPRGALAAVALMNVACGRAAVTAARGAGRGARGAGRGARGAGRGARGEILWRRSRGRSSAECGG